MKQKSYRVLLIWLVVIATVGCARQTADRFSSGPEASAGKSVENQSHHESSGSIVGNGVRSYQNARLEISFEYPGDWSVVETETSVVVTNQGIAQSGQISKVEFSVGANFDGKSVKSSEELDLYLKEKFSSEKWENVKLFGKPGFASKKSKGDAHIAEYYLWNEKMGVVIVRTEAYSDYGGTGVVSTIVNESPGRPHGSDSAEPEKTREGVSPPVEKGH